MKLISLYIENFGGLHQYSLTFEDGLTVVQEPNGFGKTTLAEFIRAMFYGFPRKAKTLDKSRRQKYTPWQGGKFGGNLIFEFEGNRYRIERTFGATPKGDSFNLIDPVTGRKSTRFSEEIGLELFRLDADSFERSTYMPQLHDLTSLTTDSIQAKLGNLVEDTGDMGNYEKAVTALKSARSTFIPYRGNGGSVAEAQGQISLLQTQVEQTAALESSLASADLQISELETQLNQLKDRQQDVRTRILASSEAAAVAAAHREYEQLIVRQQELEQSIAALRQRYPLGLPSEEQLQTARQAASDLVIHSARVPSAEDADAQTFVAQNRARFEGRIPSRDALESCRGEISRYHALVTEARSIGLSEGEKALYEKLLPLSESGKLDSGRLDRLDTASKELAQTQQAMQGLQVSSDDRTALEELKLYFTPGIPEEEEITGIRRALTQAEELRQKKAAALESLSKIHPVRPGVFTLLLAVIAISGFCLGIWFLTESKVNYALPALVIGAAALVAAFFATTGLSRKNREIRRTQAALQEEINACDRDITRHEQNAAAFAGRYTVTAPVSEALMEIRNNRDALKKLASQIAATTARQKQLAAHAQSLRDLLNRELESPDYDREILSLHLAADQFRSLREELAEARAQILQLNEESELLKSSITEFLGAYFDDPRTDRFHDLLSDLQRSSDAYISARDRVDAAARREAERLQAVRECEQTLQTFFRDHGLVPQENLREQLLSIRDDVRDWDELTRQHRQAAQLAEAYANANRDHLDTPIPGNPEDSEALRLSENSINGEIEEKTTLLLRQKQHRTQWEGQYDKLPELREQLEYWQDRKQTHQHRAAMLDDTLLFLEKARENLQNSYLGPLRRSFTGYMQQLMGESESNILLTPDLDVRLERSGEARELGYFSAGQTDTVMLCMRLALVDALFGDAKPFVILDDPFVNLDDAHTAQALELLKDLARDRQILYLVCNSSRNYQ